MPLLEQRRSVMEAMYSAGYEPDELDLCVQRMGAIVGDKMMKKWKVALKEPRILDKLPAKPRLINRFTIGADPEFTMTDQYGEYKYAEQMGLTTLTAYGADMAGRQAELRAAPSKFVIDVLASITDTLRWMYAAVPNTRECKWIAIPYIAGGVKLDGCGGHIHFGRKRPNKKAVLAGLDNVTRLLLGAGVLDLNGQKNRIYHTGYGKYSDFRAQEYGFEYRTIPTWLCHPWVAYISLVSTKLSILMPSSLNVVKPEQQLRTLIHMFKNRDDDAAIASMALAKWGMPKASSADIKSPWGIGAMPPTNMRGLYVPSVIPGSAKTKKDLFDYLTKGIPMPLEVPVPSWTPTKLVDNIKPVAIQAHIGGLPEVAMGLLSKGVEVVFKGPVGRSIKIESNAKLDEERIQAWGKATLNGRMITFESGSETKLSSLKICPPIELYSFGHTTNVQMAKEIRDFISNPEVFPICKASKLAEAKWADSYTYNRKPRTKFVGRVQVAAKGLEDR